MLRRALPVFGRAHMGRYATCVWKCGSACFRSAANRSGNEPFEAVVARAISRRALLKGGLAAAVVLGTGCATGPAGSPAAGEGGGALGFAPIEPGMLDDVVVPDGYAWEVLIRWGEPILRGAPGFDFDARRRRRRPASSATTATTSRSSQ